MSVFAPAAVSPWSGVARPVLPVARPRHGDELAATLGARETASVLGLGLARSYSDCVLNAAGSLVDMTGLDRILAFDRAAGVLRAEAGLSLDDALQAIAPQGWFFATSPGTRFVTLGGAVANDVHGKNHHAAGAFGCSVRRLGLLRSDGRHLDLGRDEGDPLFAATIGGLGLTGLITWVEVDLVRIPSTDLDVERAPFGGVGDFFDVAEASAGHEHTVAWIDCAATGAALGRGVFQRADWSAEGACVAHPRKLSLSMPLDAPAFSLNALSVRAFNALYWRQQSRLGRRREHYGAFFYPLDAIGRWNRMYGAPGFFQYQCVVPPEAARPAVTELVRQIAASGAGSFLAVLKTLGERRSPGLLSFPRAGATLALDFPNRGGATVALMNRLDAVVREARGRLYPAKDARMSAAMFRAGYGETLEAFRACVDPAFSSDFWRRVSA